MFPYEYTFLATPLKLYIFCFLLVVLYISTVELDLNNPADFSIILYALLLNSISEKVILLS